MLAKQLQGAALASQPVFIEDTFSTYLYTGNGSTQTITNGIDLSGKGGLVWCKQRDGSALHLLYDTNRGAGYRISSDLTDAQVYDATTRLTSFTSSGFTLGNLSPNTNGATFASWTFREQAKFFDVVTYTGNGANRTIPHNLGSVPGCFIVKKINGDGRWSVYHRSLGNTKYLQLNATNAEDTVTTFWNSTDPTSTVFSIGTNSIVNASGDDYIVYLFAHDAGGFGLTGTDNVISCGSYTGNGSTTGPIINLGWEPQWLLLKPSTVVDNWNIYDNMRGFTVGGSAALYANAANAEGGVAANVAINATGFQPISTNSGVNGNGQTYIYIAIRRGPMKTPTSGTSVFSPNVQTGAGTTAGQTLTTSFPVDLEISEGRATNSGAYFLDRLRGGQNYIISASTAAEVNFTGYTPLISFANNTGILDANYGSTSNAYVAWNFRRAPGFFDVVAGKYFGGNLAHNLGVVPELVIAKQRDGVNGWYVWTTGFTTSQYLFLNSTAAIGSALVWNTMTSTEIGLQNLLPSNTGIYYLFATCAGVSKVGSYTGTAALQTVNCGFAAGARFVLIKRTDSTGDWYVWDSARGISSGNDPYLLLNSTAAEVTGTNYVDTTAVGFQVTAAAPAALNASGGTYIFLAIA
tara:strand:- start:93 stop:1994 length:1902 start_codon:yes stop_codon:yes gene_type:complete